MSGPWDAYKSTSQGEAGPWMAYQAPKIDEEDGSTAGAVGETVLSVGSNMLLAPLAGLRGMGSLITGKGLDQTVQDIEGVMDEAYQPRSAKGKRYTKNTQDVLNYIPEKSGDLGEYLGGNEGRLVGEVAGEFVTDLLPFGALAKGAKGMRGKQKPLVKTNNSTISAIEAAMDKTKAAGTDLFPETLTDTTGHATAYDAGVMGTSSPTTPLRARRQMDLPLDNQIPGKIDIDHAGVSLRPDDVRGVEAAKNAELSRLDEIANVPDPIEGRQLDIFNDAPELPFELASPEGTVGKALPEPVVKTRIQDPTLLEIAQNGELRPKVDAPTPVELPRLTSMESAVDKVAGGQKFSMTAEERVMWEKTRGFRQKQGGYINIGSFLPSFEKIKELANGIRMIAKGHGDSMTVSLTKNGEKIGGAVYDKTNKWDDPKTVDAFASGVGVSEKYQGNGLATEMYKFVSELGNDIVPSKRLTADGKKMWEGFEKKGLTQGGLKIPASVRQKQGGFINFGGPARKQLDKIPGMREGLRHFIPATETVPEYIQTVKDSGKASADVEQNFLQKASNMLTKGSLYQAIKTDNPIIKYVGEKIRNADGQIKRQIGEQVHDKLSPLAQKLSSKEKADVWALQNVAEEKGFTLTPEFMREQGYNQKQIDWVTGHKEVMADMYQRMSEVMKVAGLKPVTERTAYLASRARGDFRNLVYKMVDGEKQVVGILGADTRGGLTTLNKKLAKDHPDYVIGEERFYGGNTKTGSIEGVMQMMEFFKEKDPLMKEFMDHVNGILSKDAYEYMNASSHTKQKKRVFGMEGRKLYSDAVENAKEGMQAQLRYAETMIKWSELSKVINEVKPLLAKDNGLEMPVAKQWSRDYIQGAMGNSPYEFGRHLDNAMSSLGKSVGIGNSIGAKAISTSKQLVNGLLLGFWNMGFLAMNMIQPFRTMPEMAAYIKGKGASPGFDAGLGRSLETMVREQAGGKLGAVEQGALQYAKDNHVYSSNLFESGNRVTKDVGYYWERGTQSIAAGVEQQTRKLTYLSYVHMLNESGMKGGKELYATAQNLTDVHMNNYAASEAPRIYQSTGPVGRTGYNLMSFKHNELSRLAMLARDMPKEKAFFPFFTAIASMIAFSGVMGVVGFNEADEMFEAITGKMGKPTSLKKLVLENPDIHEAFKFGVPGSMSGVDLTSRMGIQVLPGSVLDAVAPGLGKLGNIATAGVEAIKSPNEYNVKNLVREAVPNSIVGMVDRAWFSPENGAGEELSLNRKKVQANAVRNEADKLWKTLGLTGINESKQKSLDYANKTIEMAYLDKRKSLVSNAAKVLYTDGTIPADFAQKYVNAQGNPSSLAGELESMALEQKVDQHTLQLMKNAMSTSLTSMHKTLRAVGKE